MRTGPQAPWKIWVEILCIVSFAVSFAVFLWGVTFKQTSHIFFQVLSTYTVPTFESFVLLLCTMYSVTRTPQKTLHRKRPLKRHCNAKDSIHKISANIIHFYGWDCEIYTDLFKRCLSAYKMQSIVGSNLSSDSGKKSFSFFFKASTAELQVPLSNHEMS